MTITEMHHVTAGMLSQKPPLGPKVGRPPKSAVARAASRWHVDEKSVLVVRCVSDKVFPGQYYDQETGLHYNYFRDYDASTGRYIESDPIGLKDGLNTFTYVRANPINGIDLNGLVRWTGTFVGAGYVPIGGVGFFYFDLTSECKCNRKYRIKGYASTLAVGLSGRFSWSTSGAKSEFYDYRECPEPDIANGGAAIFSAATVFGGGVACTKVALGSLYSNFKCGGPVYGLEFGVSLYEGASVVTNVEPLHCCSNGRN